MNTVLNIYQRIEKASYHNPSIMINNQAPRSKIPARKDLAGGQIIINIINKLFPITLARQKRFGHWNLVIGICLVIVSCILVIDYSVFAQDNSPERIISLGPTVTRQLFLLGVEDKIIGITTYCNIPQLEDREKIGTVVEVDLEKVITLKPDLVIATALTNPKTIEKLKGLNIKVVVFGEVKNFVQLCKQFLDLAKLVNKAQLGGEIVLSAKEKLMNLQRKVVDLSKQKVIVQIGADPLWVATENSLVNDFITLAGGINVGPTGENGLISREYVVKQNPDVIIIIEMGILAENEKEIWLKFDTINAVKNKRIHIMDSYKIGSPTPVSFIETVEELFQLLHPKI